MVVVVGVVSPPHVVVPEPPLLIIKLQVIQPIMLIMRCLIPRSGCIIGLPLLVLPQYQLVVDRIEVHGLIWEDGSDLLLQICSCSEEEVREESPISR